jgi:microsomal dipeptidase-like Zn-dependent dipeptidase
MWGFADLHAHPASHLGFGADEAGNGGIFWGKPGSGLENAASTIASDLPSCDGDKHGDTGVDEVRRTTRQTIINLLNQLTGYSHGRSGWPSFRDWPHPLSVLHQQMHISWIHRAYQGGLRLMIASVTDSQTLTMLWKRGFDLFPALPQLDPDFEFESARRQLRFIERLVQANADWMEIVRTPGQAREAIHNNRLAIILSLEMDSLTVDQMVALRERFGVKHVIPIHLVNNRFGGVAVYQDAFNTSNYYLNGEFYHVVGEPDLKFRLARPQFLTVGWDPILVVTPKEIGRDEYCSLGYECCPEQPVPGCVPADQGHKNVRGLARSELRRLMEERFLIDLAHMSDHSQAEALELAEELNYPVMNSHTGLRRAGEPGESERDMRHSFAERIARLGGIVGLGTGAEIVISDPVSDWVTDYLQALETMYGRGVAFGTDMNGFAPQVPFSARPVQYPINVAARFADSDDDQPPSLERHQSGTRTFDFTADGLAHYGLLPDFLQAISQDERMDDQHLAALFRTAEETILMWERVEDEAGPPTELLGPVLHMMMS